MNKEKENNKALLKKNEISKFLHVLFYFKGQIIDIPASSDMMFAEIALKFCNKRGLKAEQDLKFFHNSSEIKINSYKSLSELNIQHMSRIDVIWS